MAPVSTKEKGDNSADNESREAHSTEENNSSPQNIALDITATTAGEIGGSVAGKAVGGFFGRIVDALFDVS